VVSLEMLRALVLALPAVEEGTSFGTLGFRVKKKLLARLRDNDTVLVLRIGMFERDVLINSEPDKYFITPHYADYPAVLIHLSSVEPDELRDLLVDAWSRRNGSPRNIRLTANSSVKIAARRGGQDQLSGGGFAFVVRVAGHAVALGRTRECRGIDGYLPERSGFDRQQIE
jgi:hypothetical protein